MPWLELNYVPKYAYFIVFHCDEFIMLIDDIIVVQYLTVTSDDFFFNASSVTHTLANGISFLNFISKFFNLLLLLINSK